VRYCTDIDERQCFYQFCRKYDQAFLSFFLSFFLSVVVAIFLISATMYIGE